MIARSRSPLAFSMAWRRAARERCAGGAESGVSDDLKACRGEEAQGSYDRHVASHRAPGGSLGIVNAHRDSRQ